MGSHHKLVTDPPSINMLSPSQHRQSPPPGSQCARWMAGATLSTAHTFPWTKLSTSPHSHQGTFPPLEAQPTCQGTDLPSRSRGRTTASYTIRLTVTAHSSMNANMTTIAHDATSGATGLPYAQGSVKHSKLKVNKSLLRITIAIRLIQITATYHH